MNKKTKIIINLFFISVFSFTFLFFSFLQDNNKKYQLNELTSGIIKIEDFINIENYIFEINSFEDKKLSTGQLKEFWNFNSTNKEITIESISDKFYIKTIFSDKYSLLYKETIFNDKSEKEILKFENPIYVLEKYKDGKLKDKKKYSSLDDDIILVDTLNLILRLFTANKNYENKDYIEFKMGFIQNKFKFDARLNIKKISSLEQLDLNIETLKYKNFKLNNSILYEIEPKIPLNFTNFKTLYIYNIEKPFNQILVFFGNSKSYYFALLKDFKFDN